MAINPHDDYEALAKLLYPSIEASGNVYYGQTRKSQLMSYLIKITMVLNLGFQQLAIINYHFIITGHFLIGDWVL